MKKLREYATFKNLNTATTTVIDDEGNVEEIDGDESGELDFGASNAFDDLGDSEFDNEEINSSIFGDNADEMPPGMEDEFAGGIEGEDGSEFDEGPFGEEEESDPNAVEGDPDFQGIIRTVTGACLAYKRKTEDGTFEELWVYNIGKNMRTEVKIRRSIMSGTDIPAQDISSPDGTQTAETTTIGNVQFLKLIGLPN